MTEGFFFSVLGALARQCGAPAVPPGVEWECLGALVARHGAGPVFSHYYGACDEIPEPLRKRWRDVLMTVLLVNERALKATVKLTDMLREEGIPAVVLRGMGLIHRAYPEPYLRTMQDVDILIESAAGETVVPRLAGRGLSPIKRLRGQFVYRIDETDIEIHWSFLTPKRYRGIADFDTWVRSGVPVSTPQGDLTCLSLENEFIEILCHAFVHHELDAVQGLVDIGRLMSMGTLDWSQVRSWAEETATGRMFRFVTAYVTHLLQLDIDPAATGLDAPLPVHCDDLFESYRAMITDQDGRIHFLRRKRNLLFMAERPSTKLKQLIRFFGRRDLRSFAELVFGRERFARSRKHVGVEKRIQGGG